MTTEEAFPPIIRFQADDTTAFLRAARSGNLEKVIEFLDTDLDINTANSNGLNALHLASKDGHVEIVTELLKRGAKVDAATKKGNTALHIASLAGQVEIVNILIQYGAAVNIQSQNGFTPLYMAAQENHDQVVKLLLGNGANQSLATEDGFTPLAVAMQQGHDKVVSVLLENDSKGKVRLPALHIAAKKDDCKAADLLLQNDHKPDVTSKSGFTPLHIAAHYGNEEIARLLIKRGADVNYLAKHNISPLHVAAKWGKNNMVKVLLENSAQIDAKTRDGLTPLHCAARSGHEQVITTLLEHSAPISARTKNGLAPLHMASQGDHVDAARVLLYHRAPVDEVTIDYLTSLHVAAHCGHVRVAKLLLDRKADPNARALNGFTPLHIACKKNRIKVVELLLKHGASIESTTESGLTPLHVASFMGCMNIVIFLLQHEANPDVPTVRGETPLHLAARANQTDIIRILLRNGAKVDARAREQQTPLHIASRLRNIDIVMLLLQHGAAVDTTTKDMYTALHIAAKEGQEEVATILVENNASLKATTKNGFTPLHIAAKYGNMSVAKILLQRDSKLDAQGKNDISPLHLACHYDHPNVANLLLEKGASPHLASQNGHTPLHIAARKNQMDIASTLLENGANANAESKAGFTPLHLSAQKGHYDMTNLLIEHGADPNHKSKNGLTALHLCAQEDFIKVASILVKNGANVESETETGYRPIHVAAHFGNLSMIRFLLKHSATIDVKSNQNYTPLHQAAQQGHAHIVSALLEGNASHKARTNDGLTALNIAQKLGYISVMEVLKGLSYDTLAPDNKNWDEKYKVIAPESIQETSFMSDSEDEGGSDALISEQPYRYLTADLMKSLRDDSLPIDVTRDDPIHRQVTKEEKQDFTQSNNYCLAENFDTDGFNLGRLHFRSFLVSFLVDARGGAMKGCRHSGVRIIVPPRRATMPIRVTCRLIKPNKIANPPPLMEGEALATRIMEMGPVGATFLGPVLIDIPHFASIRGKEREIIILRSENGETWKEHDNSVDNDTTLLNTPYDPQMSAAHSGRITRIITTDFPQYFAIITRIKQEVHVIGAEGGILTSSVANDVQAVFPPGALTKKIKVGLQAHVIPAELTAKLLGNCVAVSPVITIEPRRRKFHKPITLTIPVPQAANKGMINHYGGETPTLRLLCSIAGGTSESQWEDVTGSTPLTFMNDTVSFTTTVSARFWLMDCRNIGAVPKMATELYEESLFVPYITNFVIYSKRMDVLEATLRILCMTDGKEGMHTLERQEEFVEIVKSRDVEALDGKDLYIEFSGNLVPVTKSGVQLKFTFKAFRQNRLSFHVKVKDPLLDPVARMLFMREPKVAKGEPPQQPICVLNIVLPEITTKVEVQKKLKDYEDSNIIDQKLDSYESKYKMEQKEKGDEPKDTSPSEQKFITDTLQKERTDAVTIHEFLAQKAACSLESVDASYPSKVVGQEQDLSPSVERQTYSEKRKFWEDISRKRESYQRSESEISRTSQLTINESDSEYIQNITTEDTADIVQQMDKSETLEDLNVPDISECSVAEKAQYFEEQIQKETTKIPPKLLQQDSLKSEKEKLGKTKISDKEKLDKDEKYVAELEKVTKVDEKREIVTLQTEERKQVETKETKETMKLFSEDEKEKDESKPTYADVSAKIEFPKEKLDETTEKESKPERPKEDIEKIDVGPPMQPPETKDEPKEHMEKAAEPSMPAEEKSLDTMRKTEESVATVKDQLVELKVERVTKQEHETILIAQVPVQDVVKDVKVEKEDIKQSIVELSTKEMKDIEEKRKDVAESIEVSVPRVSVKEAVQVKEKVEEPTLKLKTKEEDIREKVEIITEGERIKESMEEKGEEEREIVREVSLQESARQSPKRQKRGEQEDTVAAREDSTKEKEEDEEEATKRREEAIAEATVKEESTKEKEKDKEEAMKRREEAIAEATVKEESTKEKKEDEEAMKRREEAIAEATVKEESTKEKKEDEEATKRREEAIAEATVKEESTKEKKEDEEAMKRREEAIAEATVKEESTKEKEEDKEEAMKRREEAIVEATIKEESTKEKEKDKEEAMKRREEAIAEATVKEESTKEKEKDKEEAMKRREEAIAEATVKEESTKEKKEDEEAMKRREEAIAEATVKEESTKEKEKDKEEAMKRREEAIAEATVKEESTKEKEEDKEEAMKRREEAIAEATVKEESTKEKEKDKEEAMKRREEAIAEATVKEKSTKEKKEDEEAMKRREEAIAEATVKEESTKEKKEDKEEAKKRREEAIAEATVKEESTKEKEEDKEEAMKRREEAIVEATVKEESTKEKEEDKEEAMKRREEAIAEATVKKESTKEKKEDKEEAMKRREEAIAEATAKEESTKAKKEDKEEAMEKIAVEIGGEEKVKDTEEKEMREKKITDTREKEDELRVITGTPVETKLQREVITERETKGKEVQEDVVKHVGKEKKESERVVTDVIVRERVKTPEIKEEDVVKEKSTGRRIITEETTIIYKVQKDGTLVQEQVLKSVQVEGGSEALAAALVQIPEGKIETKSVYEVESIGDVTSEVTFTTDIRKEMQKFLEGERTTGMEAEDKTKKEIASIEQERSEKVSAVAESMQEVEDGEIGEKREESRKEEREETRLDKRAVTEMETKHVRKEFESRIPVSTAKIDKEKIQKETKPKGTTEAKQLPSKLESDKESSTEEQEISPTTKKKEFESRIPKRVIDVKSTSDKPGKKDTHVRKESESFTITEKKLSEEVTSKLEEHLTTKSETQTFSKSFTDPREAFKMFEDMEGAKSEFATVTSKIDHKTSTMTEKKEVVSSEISNGTDKVITLEEKERVERKKSSESQLKKESPTETLEEKKSKHEELDKTAIQKLSMNLTDTQEIIDAAASESRTETKKEEMFKKLSDKEGVMTREAGSSLLRESDAEVAIRIKKDIGEKRDGKDEVKTVEGEPATERISKPVADSDHIETLAQGESRKETKESFDVIQFVPSERKTEEKDLSKEEKASEAMEERVTTPAESLEEKQRQKFKEIEARTIAETLIQSIESEIEAKSAADLKTELLSKGYLEQIISESVETDHEKLADDLTRKFESIMRKTLDEQAARMKIDESLMESPRLRSSIQEESQDKSSTRDSISVSEDITKDEESSPQEKEESFPLSLFQAKLQDRDITMSPSSISEQIDFEETIDVDTNELESVSKPTSSSPQSEKQRFGKSSGQVEFQRDLHSDVSLPRDKIVSEISGARVLEILEPGVDSQSREDSVDVPSLEMDEHKISEQTSRGISSLHESTEMDSFDKLVQERDITLSPSTVSEDTNTDYSLVQESSHPIPTRRDLPMISTKRADSFEIESPPLVSPKPKVRGLEIKPVDWMIGDEKIEISETLQPSQIFNQELEAYESKKKKERLSSLDGSTDHEQESGGKSLEEISVIESSKETDADDSHDKSTTSSAGETKLTAVPVSEQDFESELVENKLEVSCQELVDTLQREYDSKTPMKEYVESIQQEISSEYIVEAEKREVSPVDESVSRERTDVPTATTTEKSSEDKTREETTEEDASSVTEASKTDEVKREEIVSKSGIELKLEKTTTESLKESEKPAEEASQEAADSEKPVRVNDVLKEWTEAYLSKMKPLGDDYKRHMEKATEKHDKPGRSATVPSDTCAFKIKKDDLSSVDLSARYAITVLDQVVKKEIAEVKESLEAAKQDLIEELSENSETVIQIKDSPSEFRFKLQPESIPNDLPFLYTPSFPEQPHESDTEAVKSESPVDKSMPCETKDSTESKMELEESTSSSIEEPIHPQGDTPAIKTEKSDAETAAITVQEDTRDDEEEHLSPVPASRSGSDVDNKDESSSLALPRPVLRRRQKPGRSPKRVTSDSDADLGSSSGESSNYQSCDYEIGSGSRPSSSDVEALQSCGVPSATASEYETAMMSIEHSSSSKPTSQEYHTAATTMSSRESMKSLTSLSSGHLGSIDSTSELSETLVPSETDAEKEEAEERLDGALEEEHTERSDSSGSDIPIDEPMDSIYSSIPCRMKRSSEMIFPQVLDNAALEVESTQEPTTKDAKGIDFATSTLIATPGTLRSVDIMTSRVSEDGVQSVCTQVISTQTTSEIESSLEKVKSETLDAGTAEKEVTEEVTLHVPTTTTESELLEQKYVAAGVSSESPEMSMQTSTPSIMQQASMSTSSTSGVSIDTVVGKEKSDRHSPDSDSFEMVDKPDIIDDFVVIEEVGKEAEEYDSEGKSIRISSIPQTSSKQYDRDLENLITENKQDSQVSTSQTSKNNELFDFESEESPPQVSNDDQYSQSYSDEEQYEGGKKWIEMQFHADARVYDIEYDRGPLEDIKEEEITDFEAGSSRFGSLGSHKESIGSVGSMRGSFGSTPDYDVLTGKKYFTRPSDHDNVSLSSLQEFEHLESAVAAENSRKLQCGSHDSVNNGSLPRRYMTSRSGHGDDISLSSLKDFEGLEKACREAHLIELRAREEEDLLEHESPENKYKLESLPRTRIDTSTAGSFNASTSGSDDYEKRIKEIDEIIRIAQSNVEKFDRQDDTTEDISQIEITDVEKIGTQAAAQSVSKPEEPETVLPLQRESNVMETSTDSLELEDNMDKKHHPLCRSSDSLEMKTTLDFPSLSSDSLNNVRDTKEMQSDVAEHASGVRRISSDSLDMPLLEQQDTESHERPSNEDDHSDGITSDNSLEQRPETVDTDKSDKTRTTPSTNT